jgi:diaminohydroxyphosphoribosylaminopyrimidine deaminase/5-amino-6-(5-phosphoribosylamino)uracil reductase
MNDTFYMQTALELARKGSGFTSPNPMVGALVVKDDQIIGQGYHHAAGEAHAEANALANAQGHTKGATLYVTLEPCNHVGRTPPCTQAIKEAGIIRVVIAMADPNPKVTGGGIEFLKAQGIEVSLGLLETDACKLNEAFIKYITTGKPFVVAKCAATLDGQIATRTGDAKWVTGEKAREYVHHLRHALDAIMVGSNTVKADNPQLTSRLNDQTVRQPLRLVLDSRLSISENAHVLNGTAPTWIITSDQTSAEQREVFRNNGVHVVVLPMRDNQIDLKILIDYLGEQGITSLLIEGGSRVMASAFKDQIFDKLLFFYAPKVFTGNDGYSICQGSGPAQMADCITVQNMSVNMVGEDVLVEGYLENKFVAG